MIVLLFDIDGTLISTGGAGQTALDSAFAEEFGITRAKPVPISGRTDRSIVKDFFQMHAVDETPANLQRFRDTYVRHLPHTLRQRPGRVLPGIHELLTSFQGRSDVALGLLTGNVYEGARIKLEHYSMFHYFKFGGFGDESLDRNHVAEIALASARQHVNHQLTLERTWVIGDTPLDIRCARWIGVKVCAVATGMHKFEDLAAENPDLILADLSAVNDVVEKLAGLG